MNAFAFFRDGRIKRLVRWSTKSPNAFEQSYSIRTEDVKYFSLLDGDYAFASYVPLEQLAGVRSSYINSALHPSHGFFKWNEDYRCWFVADIDKVEFYELKPCPFCGTEGTMQVYQQIWENRKPDVIYRPICMNERCIMYKCGSISFDNPVEAVQLWNERK